MGHTDPMTLVLDLPDSWESLLGLDSGDAANRARQMLVLEGYREGRLSRGQVSEMLGLGFHETESLLATHHAWQQPTWDDLEAGSDQLRSRLTE
jgi:predicted HTH domain antitoxin